MTTNLGTGDRDTLLNQRLPTGGLWITGGRCSTQPFHISQKVPFHPVLFWSAPDTPETAMWGVSAETVVCPLDEWEWKLRFAMKKVYSIYWHPFSLPQIRKVRKNTLYLTIVLVCFSFPRRQALGPILMFSLVAFLLWNRWTQCSRAKLYHFCHITNAPNEGMVNIIGTSPRIINL